VLTSATPLEGKSVVAANLAIAMAQGGLRTILLSMDLRKPTLHKIFGLDTSPGITDFLLGNGDASRVIKTVADLMIGEMGVENIMLTPGIDNLHIITCGKIPSNPVQLIQSEKFRGLLDALYGSYDVILMDTPPLISAADASILAMMSDGVLLVYRAGEVGRGILKRIKDQLEQVKATIIGVVLNGVKAEISPDFDELKHHKYYYYYRGEDKKKRAEKKKGGRKSLRLFLLSIVLCLVLGGLLWQTGILDLEKYGFKGKPALERSSAALASIKILKPKKSPTVPSADAREPVSPPSPPSPKSVKIQGNKIKTEIGNPENKSIPAPKRTISEFSLAKVPDPPDTDKPQKKSSPKPPPPPVHYPFSVMTGSFKTWKGANEAMASLKEKGLSPYWTLANLEKAGTWYRVCVGHFETSQDAKAFVKRFGLKESAVIKTAYSNSIGDFASKQEIEQKLASLKKAGYSPYVIEEAQKGYKLLVGAHLKREAADEMAGKLKDAGIDSEVVLR
jgi:capsular exopolysaccharide synthesis family protein